MLRFVAIGGAAAAYILLARPRLLTWGATDQESDERLPGDDLIVHADLTATRAITIRAPADQVWPWIAQLGQGRGGFYSYDFLETCWAATSTARIGSCLSGKTSQSATKSGSLRRSVSSWPFWSGGEPLFSVEESSIGNIAPPYDTTWAFVLRAAPDETTRLLVRERYAYTRPWARLIIEPTEALSFVMSQKMLRGIKDRAELTAAHHEI